MVAVTSCDPEQVGHQHGQTLLGEQLVVQQIQHEGADPCAVLHRRGHPFGERRPRLPATRRTTADVCAVLGDDQRPWFRQIEYLPGDVVGCHRRAQRFAARSAAWRIMVDRPHRAFRFGAASRPDGPSARQSSCRTVGAGC